MSLNEYQKTELEREYDSLAQYVEARVAWSELRQHIVAFCEQEGIELYQLKALPKEIAKVVIRQFIEILPGPSSSTVSDEQVAAELKKRLIWKEAFKKLCTETMLVNDSYDDLRHYLSSNLSDWKQIKEAVIVFCLKEGIELYNIRTLPYWQAQYLLRKLVDLIAVPLDKDLLGEEQYTIKLEERRIWKQEFLACRKEADEQMLEDHRNADLSVGHQFQRTGKVSRQTLLTLKDMKDLLGVEGFNADDTLKSDPFPLAEIDPLDAEPIQTLINQVEKDVFLPIVHDGHWFYLKREKGEWVIHDSQPYADGGHSFSTGHSLTPRQGTIYSQCFDFLEKMHKQNDFGTLRYFTTGTQSNDYECGTYVVNAWRQLANRDYVAQSHDQILFELLDKQVPNWREIKKSREARENEHRSSSSRMEPWNEALLSHGKEPIQDYPFPVTKLKGYDLSAAHGHRLESKDSLSKVEQPGIGLGGITPLLFGETEQIDRRGLGQVTQAHAAIGQTYTHSGSQRVQSGAANERVVPTGRRSEIDTSNGRGNLATPAFKTRSFTVPTEREKEFKRRIAVLEETLEELLDKAAEFEEIKKEKIREYRVFVNEHAIADEISEPNETLQRMQEEIEKYRLAEEAAKTIHGRISEALDTYKENPSYQAYSVFQRVADKAIKENLPILATPRNKDKMIGYNILGLIAGLVIFYFAYAAIDYFSDPKRRGCSIWATRSEKIVRGVEDALDALDPVQIQVF